MKLLLAVILIVVSIPSHTNPQKMTTEIGSGFLTGKDYLDLDAPEKRAYAMGQINGMLVAPLFMAPKERVGWLQTCTVNMTDEQVAAILTKYLRDNPGEWHHPLNFRMYKAMQAACPKASAN